MNLHRLVSLGILAREGPLHGHAIRRRAEKVGVDRWAGVRVGALHRELHQLEQEGLVSIVRQEHEGRRPMRTVYRITDEGLSELGVLREQALRTLQSAPDPFGVALLFGRDEDRRELGELLRLRERTILAMLEQLRSERERLRDHLRPESLLAFRRHELVLQAEAEWHLEAGRSLAVPGSGDPNP